MATSITCVLASIQNFFKVSTLFYLFIILASLLTMSNPDQKAAGKMNPPSTPLKQMTEVMEAATPKTKAVSEEIIVMSSKHPNTKLTRSRP
jgi:type IV secretory pathway VirB2 component (pilin)